MNTILRFTTVVAFAGLATNAAAQANQGAPTRPRVDSTGVGDTSLFAPIPKRPGNVYRAGSGAPGPRYWQQQADYDIKARLDTTARRLDGEMAVRYANNSPDTLTFIWVQVEQNAFKSGSLASLVFPSASRFGAGNFEGGDVIERFNQVIGTAAAPVRKVLKTRLEGTMMKVDLASPLAPGQTAVFDVAWHFLVPEHGGDRMGRDGALYEMAQWYPRLAVYDDLRGWDSELYLGPSEFYNDFGRFDVRIDVPAGWIVSGTGVLQNANEVLTSNARVQLAKVTQTDGITTIVGPDEVGPGSATAAGSRLTWHLVAENVNDFAWATAKKFVWQATRASIVGKGYVPVNMYYLPGHAGAYANAGPLASHALEYYSKLWFPYTFPQLTLQDGPSAGMEYPMVINSNQGAADHETGHQWWPMTVSNNETWYGWMDEGYNQYMNILSAADRNHTSPNLNGLGQSYGRTSGNEAESPMMWNANYAGPGFYGFTTYSKMPLLLSMLGGVVGDSAVQRAHSEWGKTWSFKHPSPWDWMFYMNNALHQDLGWFWYYWLFTTESVDGSIADVKSSGGKTTVTVKQAGQMPSPVVLQVRFAVSGPAIKPMKNARMVDETTAIVTWPVDVWFDGRRSFDAVLDFGGRAVESVTFDPCGRFPDADPSDNTWPRTAAAPAPGGGRGGRGQAAGPKALGCE